MATDVLEAPNPEPQEVANCHTCGAEIIWLKHERTGKPAPIEAKVSDDGNIVVNLAQRTYAILPKDERPAMKGWLHLNHFVRCPQAKFWARAARSPA